MNVRKTARVTAIENSRYAAGLFLSNDFFESAYNDRRRDAYPFCVINLRYGSRRFAGAFCFRALAANVSRKNKRQASVRLIRVCTLVVPKEVLCVWILIYTVQTQDSASAAIIL